MNCGLCPDLVVNRFMFVNTGPCLQSGLCSKRLIRLNIETRVPVCWEHYRLLQNLPDSSLDLRYGTHFE